MVLPHSSNIHLQTPKIDRKARSLIKGHRPAVLWFTGLSGAGKSTIASLTEQKLAECGAHTMLLDGDNVRHGLNRDLGFVDADRVENVRRIAEVSKLMYNAGLITLVSFISPFRQERQLARAMVDGGDFFEVFVDIPLEVAEKRDVKGLYAKARAGKLPNFTGIDSRYEAPLHPEITLATDTIGAEDAAEVVLEHLSLKGIVNR